MTREEIISGLEFTVEMFLFDPSTGEKYTEPRNDMGKTTIDACKGAIELLKQEPTQSPIIDWNNCHTEEQLKGIATTKNDLGVDAISRADARKAIIDHQYSNNFCEEHNIDWSINTSMALIALSDLTPVTPIRPKGQWEHGKELCKEYQGRILVDVTYADWHCSNCNYVIKGTVKPKWNYCPNCGTDMREVEGCQEKKQ